MVVFVSAARVCVGVVSDSASVNVRLGCVWTVAIPAWIVLKSVLACEVIAEKSSGVAVTSWLSALTCASTPSRTFTIGVASRCTSVGTAMAWLMAKITDKADSFILIRYFQARKKAVVGGSQILSTRNHGCFVWLILYTI